MPFNGSGVFTRIYNWVNDADSDIAIRADRFDNELDGIATALSTCITKDGQTTVTQDLPMASKKHTGVGNGTARTHYCALGQAQDGLLNWAESSGSADAIAATYSPAVTTLVDGQICFVRAGYANATTTPTFSPNSLTARTIVKSGGQALLAGDIYGAGHELILRYDLANTRWELLNPSPAPAIAESSSAIVTKYIGEVFAIYDSISGSDEPDNSGTAKYIKLTAGLTGSGAYNEGLLTSESTSGSDPDVTSTAVIVGGPMDGETVHLINTERMFLRAGSSGTIEDDLIGSHYHTVGTRTVSPSGDYEQGTSHTVYRANDSSTMSASASTANYGGSETRPRNIGITYFMRVQ